MSPATGVFEPAPVSDSAAAEGEYVEVGGVVGHVGGAEVRSPFAGWLMGIMTIPGERVSEGQPVAWLRTR